MHQIATLEEWEEFRKRKSTRKPTVVPTSEEDRKNWKQFINHTGS